jgi:hypothetical protein
MITPARLEAFLKVMEQQSPEEWTWKADRTGRFCYVRYDASIPPFQFFIEFNDEILYVQYELRDFRVQSPCWLALYRVLLRLNEELSLVKFGLTAHGDVTMMGEVPAAQFSLDVFQNLLRLMVHYLEQLYWEIGIVAESTQLAPFLTGHETKLATHDREIRDLVQSIEVEEMADARA